MEHRLKECKRIDRFGTTFYGEEEVEVAQKFRKILAIRNIRVNKFLKELITDWVRNNK